MTRRATRAAAAAFAASLVLACVRNPATGGRQFSLISEGQEISMGQEAAKQVKETMPAYPDDKLQAYVSGVGMRLAKASERPNLPWSFIVLDDTAVNAFALPGGPIFITRGILSYMTSEAELASVLGHEIGHVTARHSAEQVSKQELAQVGLGVASVLSPTAAALGQVAGAGLQLLFLKYGRDDERQADQLGFRYMHKQGYDPRQMAEMFKTLDRYSAQQGGGGTPSWLQTHPDPGDRVKVAEQRVAALGGENLDALKVDRDGYLSRVNGLVFGEDPRQGFFKGDTFVHPALKLQMTFPKGWKKQNTPSAVVAVSAKQDAILQLASAGKDPPDQALKKFVSQQGIQASAAQQSNLNGLPAAASAFQAKTQQGAIAGMVAFVSQGGQTLGILGYAPAEAFSGHEAELKAAINSFGPLQDRSVENVQPAKVELVRVPRDMSVAEFNAQFPSTVPIEVIATINGVDKNGTLKGGQQAKRVTGGTPPPPPSS
jgi:predicted Zn-dependent protease